MGRWRDVDTPSAGSVSHGWTRLASVGTDIACSRSADVVERIVGIIGGSPTGTHIPWGQDAPTRLGVTWYTDRPVGTDERTRGVTLTPFAYLDLDAIRRRAFDLFPFQSQWSAHAAWLALDAEHRRNGHRP